MTTEEREAYHQAGEARLRTFSYEKPQSDDVKKIAWLVKDPEVTVDVQIVKDGGENNLHAHTNAVQVYFVLAGRVRFYGNEHVLIEELGPQQGIFIPAGARYYFAKAGSEDLQLLQIMYRTGKSERIDIGELKPWMVNRVLGPDGDKPEPSRT